MELTDLKLFAIFYIREQKIPDQDKIRLMNFIECADGDEILFLLATGQIPLEENMSIKEIDGQAFRMEGLGRLTKDVVDMVGMSPKPTAQIAAHAGKTAIHVVKTYKAFKQRPENLPTISGTAVSSMASSLAYKVQQKRMKIMGAKCEKETGAARKACYNMIRRDSIRAEILALSSMKTKCQKSKSPETCIKNIDKRIKELQQRMDTIKVST